MLFKEFVANIGMILTIFQFLSGSLICKTFIKQGHTGTVSGFTFVSGVLSTGLWLIYSLLLEDVQMTITNCVGVLTQVVYLLVYMRYCTAAASQSLLRKQMTMLLLGLGTIVYYVIYSGIKFETVKFHIGLLCCVGSIIFCASPLASLAEVVKNKSTASLPFPLLLLMFLVTLCWGLYGYLIADTFVLLPNLICSVIAGLQLLLFLVYPSESGDGKKAPSMGKGSVIFA